MRTGGSGAGTPWLIERDIESGWLSSGAGPVYPPKISFGGNQYLLVRPQGGQYWHDLYRYGGTRKTLFLGTFPDVPVTRAQSRDRAARRLLAAGVDPSLRRRELRGIEGNEPEAGCGIPGNWLQTARAV